jgi:hypothetical protein
MVELFPVLAPSFSPPHYIMQLSAAEMSSLLNVECLVVNVIKRERYLCGT